MSELPAKPPEAGDDWVWCRRAQRWGAPVESIPYFGALGDEIRQNTCRDSWEEWLGMEVMVINELRLNFMDPKSQEILLGEMRRFLNLEGADALPPSAVTLPPEAGSEGGGTV